MRHTRVPRGVPSLLRAPQVHALNKSVKDTVEKLQVGPGPQLLDLCFCDLL
jgi:hypothetical protein